MGKLKLPIIILVVVGAAVAGLMASGMIGGKAEGPTKKHVVEPVPLAEPFLVNLADTDTDRYLSFGVAVQLEPMDDAHWAAFAGGGGGHGGGGEPPGPIKVSTYPKFYDAVISVAGGFEAAQLKTLAGQAELKADLLDKFAEIAETDEAEAKSSASADDPAHLGPPYHVMDVTFTKFVVQ